MNSAVTQKPAATLQELNHWMLESSPDCVKILDLDGQLLEMNCNGQSTMEIDDFAAICGKPWISLWGPENREIIGTSLEAARRGDTGRFDAFCPTAKGTPKWWDVTVTPIRGKNGQIERILSVSRDITALHNAKEEQREIASRLQFTLRAAQVGEWDLDLATGKAICSLQHDRCFGYSQPVPDWGIDTFMAHVHPEDRDRVQSLFEATIHGDKECRFECRVIWPDASVHWIEVHGSAYLTSNSKPTRLLGIVVDVTKRKRAEALADGQKKALELAVAGAPLKSILEVLTRTAEQGTGESIMTSVLLLDSSGKHLRHGAAPSLPAAFSAAIDGVAIGPAVGSCGTAAYLEQTVIVTDIQTDPLWANYRGLANAHGLRSCWSQPILSMQGKVLGTFAAYRSEIWEPSAEEREAMALLLNTTALVLDRHQETLERKQAEQDLHRLAEQLSEANQRKTEFLATLAHELRNPLAPIRSALEVMQLSGDNRAAVSRVRGMMERQVSHMTHLIDDLLDVGRITSGKLELKKERVELKSIMTTAVETSLPLIEAGNHDLTVHIPDESLPMDVDPTRIAQVVSNLLNNAAKYTPAGGRIRLVAKRERDEVVISVMDNGIGLPVEALSEVFEMFTQVRPAVHKTYGGLGIGLTLVQRLVELHEGKVAAASEGIGKGSTFTVRLPLSVNTGQPQPDDAAIALDAIDPADKGVRILVVDDNDDAAETMSALLEILGHNVRVANTGGQALSLAQQLRPDVVFLDIGLPDMDGYRVARTLRKMPGMQDILLVALTGWGAESDRDRSKDAGFDHHLTKPANLAAINDILAAPAAASQ